jgi:hypothetical protein
MRSGFATTRASGVVSSAERVRDECLTKRLGPPGTARQLVPLRLAQLGVLHHHVLRHGCDRCVPAERRNKLVTQLTL